jgi:hypothetical protein
MSMLFVELRDDRMTTDRPAKDSKCEGITSASVTQRPCHEMVEPCTRVIGKSVGKVGDHHSVEIRTSPMCHHIISCKSTYIVVFFVITPNNLVCGQQFFGKISIFYVQKPSEDGCRNFRRNAEIISLYGV